MNKNERTKFINTALKSCEASGTRLTDTRRLVLEIIAASKKPIGAYDVLAQLSKKINNPKPPTAYRALEFLQQHGFIHRIESLNAYMVCGIGHRHEGSQFMICDSCGTVAEAHLCTMPAPIADKAKTAGFTLNHWNLELHGTCRECTQGSPPLRLCQGHSHDHL
ncbi:MAG: transcriptional repressor [Proteobacteria bacterium]|nr:transcriptional repressor [Pseudomonadota bacterium]